MFDKEIEFSTHEDYFAQKEDYPVPIKVNIPEWYKKLEHNLSNKTIRGCKPFFDSLTAGYLLKMPQDFHVRHNVDHEISKEKIIKDSFQTFGLHEYTGILNAKMLNLNSGLDLHATQQLEGSPSIEKNKNLPFYKILNPWKIKTPKGYSCLFVSPLNNSDDRFSIMSGIVDTDTFTNEINFPIVINGDKYPILETIIKKGTPYVQVIPFKRDFWKMTLKPRTQKEVTNSRLFYLTQLIGIYKDRNWVKKSWK
jgi:hypothetical protein